MDECLVHGIIAILSSQTNEINTFFLKKELERRSYDLSNFDEVLSEMLSLGQIKYTSLGLKLVRKQLTDVVPSCSSIVKGYFSGKSIKELAIDFQLSEESVGESILDEIGDVDIDEDLIRDFTTYKISQKQFILLYGSNRETYRYLQLKYKQGRRNILELQEDPEKTISFKEKFSSIVRKNILLDGEAIPINPVDILAHVLKSQSSPMGDETLLKKYNDIIENNNLSIFEQLSLDNSRLDSIVKKENGLVRTSPKDIALFPYDTKEIMSLIDLLNLEQYDGLYISSLLIFRNNAELMSKKSIYNEYELYSLLNKYRRHLKKFKITFVRVPSLSFGKADINRQIESLMYEMGRVPIPDFVKEFEARYGILASSLKSSYMKNYRKYVVDDAFYDINLPRLPSKSVNQLKEKLIDSWYRKEDAELVFRRVLGDDIALEYFNSYNLDAAGYTQTKEFIFKKKYDNFQQCFTSTIKNCDIFKLEPEMEETKYIPQLISRLKMNLNLIPISDCEYITIKKLNEIGITKDILESYSSSLVEKMNDGDYFTLHGIRDSGFEHQLDEYGFEDIFYQTLLNYNPSVSSSTINRVEVYCYGTTYSKESAVEFFVSCVLRNEDSMDIYEVMDLIQEHFGLVLDSELKNNPILYFNPHTLKIYRNKDVFYDEVNGYGTS